MTDPFARLAGWALQQAAALPDTLVMKQVPNPRNWFDVVSGAASVVISLALIALAVGLLPAAWNFRKSYKKVNELLDRVYGDVNPIMRHASSIADNVNYVSTAVRQDVARLQASVAAANARLDEVTRLTEQRVSEFNALLEVVQAEAEGTFVSTAAALRGIREGAATFGDDARRAQRAWASDPDGEIALGSAPVRARGEVPAAEIRVPTFSEEAEHARTRPPAPDDDQELQDDQFRHDGLEGERPRIRRPRGRPGGGAGGAA